MKKNKSIGWSLFIVECADGTYYSEICRNIKKRIRELNSIPECIYLHNHPERLPVKVVYKEENLPFKEAFAKFKYLKEMRTPLKKRLIFKHIWPNGGPYKRFLEKKQEI